MGKLDGRIALVTGAGRRRGIGRGIALELAREGADVAVHARSWETPEWDPVAELGALGVRACAVAGDVADRAAVEAFVGAATTALGPVDVLVNNAGLAGGAGQADLLELDDALWYETVDANLNGVYLVTKAVLAGMVRTGGAIVNISSVAGRAGQPRMGAYVATKFALVGLTQQLALEFAPGIRCNCICPGSTDTDMMDGTFARRDATAGVAAGTSKARRIAGLPMQRQGLPEDIGRAVVHLASDDAAWVTGQTLNVDGGQRMD